MVLTRYQAQLEDVKVALEQQDGASLKALFERAKKGRDHFSEQLLRRRSQPL
jgi:prephenate dehydrogenase